MASGERGRTGTRRVRKFGPDDFDALEDPFLNLLAQSIECYTMLCALMHHRRDAMCLDASTGEFAMTEVERT